MARRRSWGEKKMNGRVKYKSMHTKCFCAGVSAVLGGDGKEGLYLANEKHAVWRRWLACPVEGGIFLWNSSYSPLMYQKQSSILGLDINPTLWLPSSNILCAAKQRTVNAGRQIINALPDGLDATKAALNCIHRLNYRERMRLSDEISYIRRKQLSVSCIWINSWSDRPFLSADLVSKNKVTLLVITL